MNKLKIEFKNLASSNLISGYASVFNNIDHAGDIILPGAFECVLSKANTLPLLWQHDQKEPIGVIKLLKEDNYGLYFEAELVLQAGRAKSAKALIDAGAISGISIGYSVVKSHYNHKNKARLIAKVNLWEISLVTFPANPKAVLTNNQKSIGAALDRAIKILKGK